MFSVYVIKNKEGKIYTGSTQNLPDRLMMHNSMEPAKARFHRTTYKRGPWKIIFHKKCKTRNDALAYEKFLKTGQGRKIIEHVRHGE